MLSYKTIALPRRMPLTDRISAVSEQISEWLKSPDTSPPGFWVIGESLRLIKITRTEDEYRYHYSITLGAVGISAVQKNENLEELDSRAA